MSVRMLSRVWDCSRHTGNDLLMMLAIADFADDDGRAYPSVARLAEKCRMTSRNANKVIAVLRNGGELEIRQNEGPKGTNLYRIVLDNLLPLSERTPPVETDTLSERTGPPVRTDPKPLSKRTDEPSVNRQEPSESGRAVARPTPLPAADKSKKQPITFDTFAERKKAAGEKLIAEDDPIFTWAEGAGIPDEWLHLAWTEFANRYRGNSKRYADWPAAFRNAVRNNWFDFWRVGNDSALVLTTKGELARRAALAARRTVQEVAA